MAAFFVTALAMASVVSAAPGMAKRAACSPLEMVIARGTTEPKMPKYGLVMGDPLFAAVKKLIPEVTAWPVDYPASFALDSKYKGGNATIDYITKQSKACPDQLFVMAGYSQGADVMHGAGAKIDKSLYPKIVAITTFGDPGNRGPNVKSPLGGYVPEFPPELAKKLKVNCAKGDPVCTNSGMETSAHLGYSSQAWMAPNAQYIQKQFKSKGTAGPEPSNIGGPSDKGDNTKALEKLGKELGGTPAEIAALRDN